MKGKVFWLFLSLMISVLVESSVWLWPWSLWVMWWWLGRVDDRVLLWLAIITGVLLDVMLGRLVGIASIWLWLVIVVAMLLQRWFAGENGVERIWVVVNSLAWGWFFGGVRGVMGMGLLLGISAVVVLMSSWRSWGREIRLRK
ncbi:MAG: hypothetical protein BWY29_00575 [Microgenomates group bacterium ADurb.Bin238]|nr:MAG: hypothetical protein BWY29_00575 [Microgenomates group bacterium ADurb.Bin238]